MRNFRLNGINNIFIWLAVLTSLFYGVRFFDFPVMSLACLLLLIIALILQKRLIININILVIFVILICLTSITQILHVFSHPSLMSTYLGILIMLFIFLILSIFYKDSDKIFNILKCAYCLLLVSFAVQYFVYIISGYYIDYIALLSHASARYYSGSQIRFCGVFGEPAIYGLIINCFLFISLTRNNYKLVYIDFLAIITLFLSGSLSALAYFVILLIWCSFKNTKNVKYFVLLAFLIFTYSQIDPSLFNYFTTRIQAGNAENTSFNARLVRGYIEFYRLDLLQILFGVGIGNVDIFPYTYSGLSALLSGYGIVGSIIFVSAFAYVFKKCKSSAENFVAWFLTLLAAPILTMPLWWIITLSLILLNKKGTDELKVTA